jgi:hypothetical protein
MTSDEIINFLEYSGNADSAMGRTETSELKRQAAALIRRLRDERDEALDRVKGFANGNNDWRIAYNKLVLERDAALARIEELEKALEPFADMLPAFVDFLPPGAEDCAYEINGADFRLIDIRAAARALKGEG